MGTCIIIIIIIVIMISVSSNSIINGNLSIGVVISVRVRLLLLGALHQVLHDATDALQAGALRAVLVSLLLGRALKVKAVLERLINSDLIKLNNLIHTYLHLVCFL